MGNKKLQYKFKMDTDWLSFVPETDADIIITFPHDVNETTVLWFKERIETIPGIIVQTRLLSKRLPCSKSMKISEIKCQAFYIKATYESYLRNLENMHIPKTLKEEFGGGNKEFVLEEMMCFEDIDNFDTFLNSQERQSVLMFAINRIRAQKGNLSDIQEKTIY